MEKICAILQSMGWEYEQPEKGTILTLFNVETDQGHSVLLSLAIQEQIDIFDEAFVRFAVNLVTPPSPEGFPVQGLAALALINFQLPYLKLSVAPDGALLLVHDLHNVHCEQSDVAHALQILADYAGTYYVEVVGLLLGDKPQDEPVTPLGQLAENFVSMWQDEVRLDYTLASIEQIDDAIDADYRVFVANEALLTEVGNCFGAYIGEVLVRQGGGIWEPVEPLNDSAVVIGSRRYQPLRMARAFLESDQALRPSAIVRRALAH